MKTTVLNSEIAKALSFSSRIVSQNAQLPILSNVVLKSQNAKLTFLATNLEISSCIEIGAKTEEDGEIAVPAKVISELIATLSGTTIYLESDKETLKITSDNSVSKISGINTNDFPIVPLEIKNVLVEILESDFRKALNSVLFSVSKDESRPSLTGVLFIFENDKLTLVSSDGFRLSLIDIAVKGLKKETKVIIPRSALAELSKNPFSEGNITLEINEANSQAIFSTGNLILTTRVIDSQYPNYKKIIPENYEAEIKLKKNEFTEAIKLASVFAKDSEKGIKLAIKADSLEISAKDKIKGRQKTLIPIEKQPIEELDLLFNYRFIEEALSVLGSENITLKVKNHESPVCIQGEDSKLLHILMPLKS